MKFSGKMCLMIILKVRKNQGFTLSVEDTFFEKLQGGQIDSPPAVLGLSSNVDKRMQSIDSIEIYAYETSGGVVSEKEEIKYNSIIKPYKKWLTLMML